MNTIPLQPPIESLLLVDTNGHLRLYENKSAWQPSESGDTVHLTLRPQARSRDLLCEIEHYVDSHLQEKITLASVAAHFDVSVSTITQTFQKKSDTTFHSFLTQRRMNAATFLILSGIPLESVGKLVGYGVHSTFYRAFHQYFSMSPQEYRKVQQAKEKTP